MKIARSDRLLERLVSLELEKAIFESADEMTGSWHSRASRGAIEMTSNRLRVVFAATDLSERADHALRQASDRARTAGAKLVVCHVVPNPVLVNMVFPQRHVEQLDSRVELQQRVWQALIERIRAVTGRAGSEFEAILEEGAPYAKIVELAEKHRADLIVVSDRGATGLARPSE